MIGLSGPYDFLPLTDPDLKDMFGPPDNYPNSQPIDFVRAAGADVTTGTVPAPGAATPRSAMPPMLLIHGLADESVSPKNSINMAAALRARGDAVTLKLYPKLKHADTVAGLSIPARGRAPTLADIQAFVSPPPSS
jgi:acetyl esterase/lipase